MPLKLRSGLPFMWAPRTIGTHEPCNGCCCDYGWCCYCRGFNAQSQWEAAYQFEVEPGAPLVPYPILAGPCSEVNCASSGGVWPASIPTVFSPCVNTYVFGVLAGVDISANVCYWQTGWVGTSCGAMCYQAAFYKTMAGALNVCLSRWRFNQLWYQCVEVSPTYNVDCDTIDVTADSFSHTESGGGVPDNCDGPVSIRFMAVP